MEMALELNSAEAAAAAAAVEDAADIPDPGESAVLDVAVVAPPDEQDPRCLAAGGGDELARCNGIEPMANVPAAISAHCTSNPIRAILAGCFL